MGAKMVFYQANLSGYFQIHTGEQMSHVVGEKGENYISLPRVLLLRTWLEPSRNNSARSLLS